MKNGNGVNTEGVSGPLKGNHNLNGPPVANFVMRSPTPDMINNGS